MNNDQQIQAYLGQWYDIVVGRSPGARRGPARGARRWPRHPYYPQQQEEEEEDYPPPYDPYAYAQPPAPPPYPYPYPYPMAPPAYAMPSPMAAPMPDPSAPAPASADGSAPTTASGFWPGAGGSGFPFPPRAMVVDAPLPTQANRDILPMSTGVPILPTQSAQITGRPQTLVFKIGRFVISNAGTAGGAADWIVNDVKIGNRSQFVQSGDVPGDLFATNAIDTFVRFEAAQTAMDVVVVVTYIGLNESGCPFFGAMVGTAAV
jgi:hypothetical protein